VQELIALAKANPQGLTFASSEPEPGIFPPSSSTSAGVHIVHVFYSGERPDGG
jgi:hypothetical protein